MFTDASNPEIIALMERHDSDLHALNTGGAMPKDVFEKRHAALTAQYTTALTRIADTARREMAVEDDTPLTDVALALSLDERRDSANLAPVIVSEVEGLPPRDLLVRCNATVKDHDKASAYIYHKMLTKLLDDEATPRTVGRTQIREVAAALYSVITGRSATPDNSDKRRTRARARESYADAVKIINRLGVSPATRQEYAARNHAAF